MPHVKSGLVSKNPDYRDISTYIVVNFSRCGPAFVMFNFGTFRPF